MIGIHCLLRFKTTDSKNPLGVIFKKMNKDTKQLFGDLLETNKVRKKRLSLIEKSRDEEKGNNYLNPLKSKIEPTITKGRCIGLSVINKDNLI